MCGIVGIYKSQGMAATELYDSLIHLQHRGQDSAGICLNYKQQFFSHRGLGLVQEIFNAKKLSAIKGNIGIGHTRYPTAGSYTKANIQPLSLERPIGIALAHNGNLSNYQELADKIRSNMDHSLHTNLDSEVLITLLAEQLSQHALAQDEAHFFEILCQAISSIFNQVQGAYSVVSVLIDKGLVSFRDPHGIRPLVWGSRTNPKDGTDMIFSSETTPFYTLGFNYEGDVLPGEVMFVSKSGKLYRRVIKPAEFKPCVFEYVYFARPDATLNDINVYSARLRLGQKLAAQWKQRYPTLIPDVIISAPFTANTAAQAFAQELGVRYSEGLYKNPFIGRTFIMPNQDTRQRNIRYKLTPQRIEIENKHVLIVDDSIVRGTTSREIVKMIKEFGAKKIYFASTCPAIKNPCFYGIDIPSRKELIAANLSEPDIAAYLGIDVLMYQTQTDLTEAVKGNDNAQIKTFCTSCMDGDYFCNSITQDKMHQLEQLRANDRTLTTQIAQDACNHKQPDLSTQQLAEA